MIFFLDTPVKLYLDVDFDKIRNSHVRCKFSINHIMDIFLSSCNSVFNLHCTLDDVVVLNSSSRAKLSYHLIFKNVVFPNTACCMTFIQHVLRNASLIDLQDISYRDTSGSVKYIIDCKVYSRNQNFRLLGSSKFGKNVPLTIGKASILIDARQLLVT